MSTIQYLRKELFPFLILITISLNGICQENDLLKSIWLEYQFYPRMPSTEQFSSGDSLILSFNQKDGFLVQKNDIFFKNKDTLYFSTDSFFVKNSVDHISELKKGLLFKTNSQSLYRYSYSSGLFYFNLQDKKIDSITPSSAFIAETSPDEAYFSYVKDNNLFYYDINKKASFQLTEDGDKNQIINGYPDWVYEEEFGMEKAYYWNSTSEKMIYLQFNESEVPTYKLTQYNYKSYPDNYSYKYPKAGEENSEVKIKLIKLSGKENYTIYEPEEDEAYIPYLNWLNHDEIIFLTLNRLQNHLKIKVINTVNGETNILYEEQSPTYIELPQIEISGQDNIIFTSEKDGFKHIYRLSPMGEITQLTQGNYEVTELSAVNQNSIFYTANKENINGQFVYKLNRRNNKSVLISQDYGTSDIEFSAEKKYYYLTHSAWNKAPVKSLHETNTDSLVKIVFSDSTLQKRVDQHLPVKKEFTSFKIDNNTEFPAWIIKPAQIKKKEKLPVLIYTYGGPGYQTVKNQYDPFNQFWYQQLAQEGYVIVSVDVRGSGGKGKAYRTQTYGELGIKESEDLAKVSRYLANLSYVDPQRIGIWGWSYGGYLSCFCMTKEHKAFSTAVAVAPVTHWKFYDTIYSERYMQTPEKNEEGYEKSSPINYAELLDGNLMLIHGMSDDNVHQQNTYEFINALIANNKDFDLKIYPNRNHSIFGGNTRYHLFTEIDQYIKEKL